MEIALLLTGGTICSRCADDGARRSDVHSAVTLLERAYYDAHPKAAVRFRSQMPMDRLSEDLTPDDWYTLLSAIGSLHLREIGGIVIAHGTDTLEQTAAMLSAALCGISVPVILVAAISPPDDPTTNAHENFAAAISLIGQRLAGGVYAVYRNSSGTVYLHRGCDLRRCAYGSMDFFSAGMTPVEDVCKAARISRASSEISQTALCCIADRNCEILRIYPYNGLRYDKLPLDCTSAVLQETYHSGTANARQNSPYSVYTLLHRCAEQGIPCYLAPCDETVSCYGSTYDLVHAGAVPLDVPAAFAYGALWIGAHRGLSGKALTAFVRETYLSVSAAPLRCLI